MRNKSNPQPEHISNYDITRNRVKGEFLKYDQKQMIRKFKLKNDSSYLYIKFLNRLYRINRENGTVEWSPNEFTTVFEADFNVTMTLFDVLCNSKEDCKASGRYNIVKNLKGTGYTGDPGKDIFEPYSQKFDQNIEKLANACEALGGEKYVVGDVAYILPIFEFLPMVFQFWASDDEFEAQMKMKWDENVLSFMRFETVHYAMGHILQRLEELI